MPANVINLLDREMYGFGQVDGLLGLRGGTARRWIDGYERAGKRYPPVVREKATGQDVATWGEFVETRLLSEYRDAGVPLIHMRPVIEKLRQDLQTPYPLASARTWLRPQGRELVREVQEEVGLERRLALVVVRTGQTVAWSEEADAFRKSVNWSGNDDNAQPESLRPMSSTREVVIDPLRGFGEPVVRGGVRTEVIAELFTAGETPEIIADHYDVPRALVDEAVRYELLRRPEQPAAA